MIASNIMMTERTQLRQQFIRSWQQYQAKQPLDRVQQSIVAVILKHVEYQPLFADPKQLLAADYTTENNPFLHLSLHLSLAEQINTNRPHGITTIFSKLCQQHPTVHDVEHLMMDVLANTLWDAQQRQQLADEQVYLEKLKQLQR